MLTWDENKRRSNLAKHGIDFAELEAVFDRSMIIEVESTTAHHEFRLKSLCWFRDDVVVLIWISQQNNARIISCRRGTKHEKRTYLKEVIFS